MKGYKWQDVQNRQKYKALNPEQQAQVQEKWFAANVAERPKFQQMGAEQQAEVRRRVFAPAQQQGPARTSPAAQAQPEDSGGVRAEDYGRSLASGLNRFGQLMGRGLDVVGLDRAGQAVESFYKKEEAEDRAAMSEAYKREQAKRYLSEEKGETFGEAWTSLPKVLGTILESAPSMAAGMGAGLGITGGLMKAGMSAGTAGIVGGAIGEGAVGGAEAAKTAYDTVIAAPDEQVMQTEEYRVALAGLDPDMPDAEAHQAAKKIVASDAAMKTGATVGGAIGAFGAPSGAAMGRILGGEARRGTLATIMRQGGLEAAQEVPQSAAERLQQNVTERKFVDPARDVWEGVGEAAVEGGVAGFVMGGAMGGAGNMMTRQPSPSIDPDLEGDLISGDDFDSEESGEIGDEVSEENGEGPPETDAAEAEREAVRDLRSLRWNFRRQLADADRAAVDEQIKGMESPEAVAEAFPGEGPVDRYARVQAELLERDSKENGGGFYSKKAAGEAGPEAGDQGTERRAADLPPDRRGAKGKAYTPNNTGIDFEYAVVDAGELTTSHDDLFQPNPAFPAELQPRDRTRGAMQTQVNKMANNIIPERLGESADVGTGAPIIGDDFLVESGNGRSIALRNAYAKGTAENYRAFLAENAERFGLDPAAVAGLERPVLVRVRKSNVGRSRFVKEANQSGQAGMTPAEQARADSELMTGDDMAILEPDETGRLTAASNDAFVGRFLAQLGQNEAAGMINAEGRLTKQGYERLQSAVFAKAYGDEYLVQAAVEESTPDLKNVLGALTAAAPEFAKARALSADLGGLDVTPHIVEGMKILRQARADGSSVESVLAQQGMFEARAPEAEMMARFLDGAVRSPKRMGIAFRKMAELIRADLAGRDQGSLFGDVAPITQMDALERGLNADGAIDEGGDRGGERGAGAGGRAAYSVEGGRGTDAGTGTERGGIGEADIRAAFRGAEIQETSAGRFSVRWGKSAPLIVESVERIGIDEGAFRVGYRQRLTGAQRATGAAGSYQDGVIRISRVGDRFTLHHESFHHLFRAGMLSRAELRAIGKEAGSRVEEDMARWVEAELVRREEYKERGFLYKALQKIGDLVDGFGRLMGRRSARGVVTGMESGAILGRDGMATQTGAEAYSVPSDIQSKVAETEGAPSFFENPAAAVQHYSGKVVESYDNLKKNWKTRTFDKLNPINEHLGEDPYKAHRRLAGSQSVMDMLLRHGRLMWDGDGALTTGTTGEGFLPWVEKLGEDGQKLMYWILAKRAERLETEGREKWLDKPWRDKVFDWVGPGPQKRGGTWEDLHKEFSAFNRSVLEVAEEAGIVKLDTWADEIFLPMYRIMEDPVSREEFLKSPNKSAKDIMAGVKRLTGGEAKVGDPFENIMRNWTHLITESLRNQARTSAVEAARSAVAQGAQPIIEDIPMADILRFSKGPGGAIVVTRHGDENVLSYSKDGERKFVRVLDPELYQALEGSNPDKLDNLLMKMFRWSKRALTFSITVTPAFRAAAIIRDVMATRIISQDFRMQDAIRGAISTWKQDQNYVRFMAAGGGQGANILRADDPAAVSRYIHRIVAKEGQQGKAGLLDSAQKVWEFWEKVGEASENAVRVGLFTRMSEDGYGNAEAAYQARDLMDFSMSGTAGVVRMMTAMMPFLNARMQGLYRLGRGYQDDRAGFVKKGGIMALLSLALWAKNRDDERYKELEDWDRRAYYHFWVGPQHFRVPKPFEVGAIFSSAFEAAADTMYGNEELDYFASFIGNTVQETFAVDYLPHLVRPAVDAWANKSSFSGRPIENMAVERLQPGERYSPNTPETLKAIGGATGFSPLKMESLIQGYFGQLGMGIIGTADAMFAPAMDPTRRPSKTIQDYPLVGRFVRARTPKTTKYMSRFYDTVNEVSELAATVDHYKRMGNYEKAIELATTNRKAMRNRKWMGRIQRKVADLGRKARQVRNSPRLSAREKREKLDLIAETRFKIVERFYEAWNK